MFTVRGTMPNRRLVALEGSVNTVNQALHVTMSNYQHPTEARTFKASALVNPQSAVFTADAAIECPPAQQEAQAQRHHE